VKRGEEGGFAKSKGARGKGEGGKLDECIYICIYT